MRTRLIDLPTEILCNIFSLIGVYDLIHTEIYDLHPRFGWILKNIRVDLHRLNQYSKEEFDRIPKLFCASNIYSLSLSNTIIPDQIKQFLSMMDIRKFDRLESLTFIQPTSSDLSKYLPKLLALPRLHSLQINAELSDIVSFILKSQQLVSSEPNTALSKLSIKMRGGYLLISIKNFFDLPATYPSLTHFSTSIHALGAMDIPSVPLLADRLTYLKLTSQHLLLIEKIIPSIPNIVHLSYRATSESSTEIMGLYWENLLSPLKKLKRLNFFLSCFVDNDNYPWTQDAINQLKRSYETDFWIVDHEWYVNIHDGYASIDVYTMQFPVTTFAISPKEHGRIITTAPGDLQPAFNNIKILNLIVKSDLPHYFPQQKYSKVHSLQISAQANTHEPFPHLQKFLEQSLVFNHLLQLTLWWSCILNRSFYETLLQRSPNLMILNVHNQSQIMELTNTFRSRSMCSLLQKQIKKLTIRDGPIDWNEKFLETFSNLKILSFQFQSQNEDQLHLSLQKIFHAMTKIILIQVETLRVIDERFQESFRIWLTKNTSMTNTRNTVVRCDRYTTTIWNGQRIDRKLLVSPIFLHHTDPFMYDN